MVLCHIGVVVKKVVEKDIMSKIVETPKSNQGPLSIKQLRLMEYIEDIIIELEDLSSACDLGEISTALGEVKSYVTGRLEI
ncbi:hypothetical protein DES40_1079 [Litorimonas taeanensis]|uniref:Uncharacterized protein n=2 Tax=Litorimonas taeanensis TaxID=568099 RepID=A0A420WL94_9PROT|nr:hypothetical protein DES40_1079 [Litorimonas taeanensis]